MSRQPRPNAHEYRPQPVTAPSSTRKLGHPNWLPTQAHIQLCSTTQQTDPLFTIAQARQLPRTQISANQSNKPMQPYSPDCQISAVASSRPSIEPSPAKSSSYSFRGAAGSSQSRPIPADAVTPRDGTPRHLERSHLSAPVILEGLRGQTATRNHQDRRVDTCVPRRVDHVGPECPRRRRPVGKSPLRTRVR